MELGYWAGRWWIREVERVKQSSFVGELAVFLRGEKTLKDVKGNLAAWRLSTYHFSRFYFEKFKSYLHFSRTGKKSLLGGVVKGLFSALNATTACCQFPNFWVHMGTFLQRTKVGSGNSYNNCFLLSLSLMSFLHTNSTIFTVLRQDSKVKEGCL